MENYCKICFKKISDFSLFNLINKQNLLCEECFGKMKARFIRFKLGTINGLAIYEYSEYIKELIYKFKGCADYELKDVFLFRFLSYFKLKYRGYYIVFVPSYYIDDKKRGFNHVEAIFESLSLKKMNILRKNTSHKQSDQSSKRRRMINNVIEIDENICLKDKKILLVDDIMTTGSTLLTSIELLKRKGAKKINVLVIAKTKLKTKTEY